MTFYEKVSRRFDINRDQPPHARPRDEIIKIFFLSLIASCGTFRNIQTSFNLLLFEDSCSCLLKCLYPTYLQYFIIRESLMHHRHEKEGKKKTNFCAIFKGKKTNLFNLNPLPVRYLLHRSIENNKQNKHDVDMAEFH